MKKYTTMRFPGFKYKALTLSYDDDVIFDKKLMEILDKHGLKCTFNLNSGLFAEKSGDRDDVWYATNGEIFDYVKAYDGLIFSVSGNIVKNPSSIDVYTNLNGKETLIRSGETVCL